MKIIATIILCLIPWTVEAQDSVRLEYNVQCSTDDAWGNQHMFWIDLEHFVQKRINSAIAEREMDTAIFWDTTTIVADNSVPCLGHPDIVDSILIFRNDCTVEKIIPRIADVESVTVYPSMQSIRRDEP